MAIFPLRQVVKALVDKSKIEPLRTFVVGIVNVFDLLLSRHFAPGFFPRFVAM